MKSEFNLSLNHLITKNHIQHFSLLFWLPVWYFWLKWKEIRNNKVIMKFIRLRFARFHKKDFFINPDSLFVVCVILVSFQVLHYAQELFEGMKAYRGVDDQIRMFRPMHNMARYKHQLVGARHLKESPLTIFEENYSLFGLNMTSFEEIFGSFRNII